MQIEFLGGLAPGLKVVGPVSEDFLHQWNENIKNLAFLQLRLLEDECKKKLTNLNKTKSDLCIQLRDICEMGTFNCLMDIVSETILRLQSTLEVKYQTKIKRDSSADSKNSSLCYPTDFPAYIQEVDATITGFITPNKPRTRILNKEINLIIMSLT